MLGRLRPDISLRHPRLEHSQRVVQPRPKPQAQSRIVDCQASLLRAKPAYKLAGRKIHFGDDIFWPFAASAFVAMVGLFLVGDA